MSEPVFTEVQCTCGAIIGSRIVGFAKAVKAIRGNHDTHNYQDEIEFIRLAGNQGNSQLLYGKSPTMTHPHQPSSTSTTTVIEIEQSSSPNESTSKTTTYVHSEFKDNLVTPVGKLLTLFGATRDCCRQRFLTAYVYPKSI